MSSTTSSRMWVGVIALCVQACTFGGCSTDTPHNPSFDITHAQAQAIVTDRKVERPRALRPVVVIGGLYDPLNISTSELGDRLGAMLDERDAPLVIGVFGAGTMAECRRRVVNRVQAWHPSGEDAQTVEVDVVGFSLGGVVARDAAIARTGERRLNVARIFSISSPQRGAQAADLPDFDERVRSIRSGSAFIQALNASPESATGRGYELYCYIRLGDDVIGEQNAAPPGVSVWWVPTGPLERAHSDAHKDPRILADVALRLAGRPGIGVVPAASIPGDR